MNIKSVIRSKAILYPIVRKPQSSLDLFLSPKGFGLDWVSICCHDSPHCPPCHIKVSGPPLWPLCLSVRSLMLLWKLTHSRGDCQTLFKCWHTLLIGIQLDEEPVKPSLWLSFSYFKVQVLHVLFPLLCPPLVNTTVHSEYPKSVNCFLTSTERCFYTLSMDTVCTAWTSEGDGSVIFVLILLIHWARLMAFSASFLAGYNNVCPFLSARVSMAIIEKVLTVAQSLNSTAGGH